MKARSQPSFTRALRALRASLRPAPPPRRPLPVLVAYSDVPSARQALAHATRLLCARDPHCEVHPMLWRFNQLDDPRWQEMALRDAVRADLLVLAMPHEDAFCSRTEAWLNGLLARTRGVSLNVLIIVGENEPWTLTLAQPARAPAAPDVAVSACAPPNLVAPPPARATEVFASPVPRKLAARAA